MKFIKLVFLDIDGVLNTSLTFKRCYFEYKKSGKFLLPIDEFRLEFLKRIIDETEAKIVLSSTWRGGFKKENGIIVPITLQTRQLFEAFSKYGLSIYDITPCDENLWRENEILEYLRKKDNVETFIILDDEERFLKYFFGEELILVKNNIEDYDDFNNGLLEEHVEESIKKLNKIAKIKTLK